MLSRVFLRHLTVAAVVLGIMVGSTTAGNQATEDAGLPRGYAAKPAVGADYAERLRAAKYPAQLAGSTGAIRPDQHGPQRDDPTEAPPAHAYSPFDARFNAEHPCPPGGCDFVAGRVLIKFAPEVTIDATAAAGRWTGKPSLDGALASQGVERLVPVFPMAQPPKPGESVTDLDGVVVSEPDLTRWYRVTLATDSDVTAAVESLARIPGVAWVEPDFSRKPVGNLQPSAGRPAPQASGLALPGPGTDPLYSQQWHLDAANIPTAWAYLEGQGLPAGGSRDIVVAVIDTGVDYTHPDLAVNLWVNPAEFNGIPGVDDDHNGYVDDIHGVDTVTPDGNPMDDHGHGTHVAGIIAAQANNGIGGVGVAYNVQIMPIKAAQYSGVLAASDIAEGIYYAVEKGADVVNMSFGGYARAQVEEDALAVAFGQAVLVAAAGNDGNANEAPCLSAHPMYPASYDWVLGVMASTVGGSRASFSNYDCAPHTSIEYELMAPGIDIWSTLPDGNYAAWDGTSMAAPVVSGIAALVRTKWSDRDMYSSRFIMGQVASNAGPVANAYAALSTVPRPELSYLEHWIFDTASKWPGNDDDGIVDAGETIDVGIAIRNHWGKADPVTATLEAWVDGAGAPDPYVTMITGTVSYGAIGSFNEDDNGLIYDEQGVVVGVQFPFQFTVPITTPNDHVIPFRLVIAAHNGLDPLDPTLYTYQSRFDLVVQRGRELPTVISEDTVLSNDYYWIIPRPILIEAGVTVTITAGAQVQFWAGQINDPYTYLQVEGRLVALGEPDTPVEIFPSSVHPYYAVDIRNAAAGATDLSYVRWMNPVPSGTTFVDHSELLQARPGDIMSGGPLPNCAWSSLQATFSRISSLTFFVSGNSSGGCFVTNNWTLGDSLCDNCIFRSVSGNITNTVFLINTKDGGPGTSYLASIGLPASTLANNAILNRWWIPDRSKWMTINGPGPRGTSLDISANYWGTTSSALVDEAIWDVNDDFNLGRYIYQPIITAPNASIYPFVVDVRIATPGDPDASQVGPGTITFTVTFNRDMATDIQPRVSFGPAQPYTDFTVGGTWVDASTWQGTYAVTPTTGDGYHLIRVAGATAANDPWLVTGDDAARFRFEVVTSGSSAMNMQSTGGEGFVDLTWMQTDFDLLSGFNLYRSTSHDGPYTRLNASIVPPHVRAWRDANVTPGQPYYYKFTVVKSDMTESDFSNITEATPIDTIAPVISHTPVSSTPPLMPLTLFADVTDNVGVQSVTLYYRHVGDSTYAARAMAHTTGNRYAATLEGSLLTSPGIEYYVEATDGVSIVRHGRPEYPHQVVVVDRPVVTGVTPSRGTTSGGTTVTISGSNFKPGATVTFGGAACSAVVVVSGNQITCSTPPHFPEIVDVTVTNLDSQSGTLLRGYTYESDTAFMSVPHTGGGQHSIVMVPINLASVEGLVAASLTATFEEGVLDAQGATTGSLTPGWSMVANTITPGQVRISMSSAGGTVGGSGVLAYLQFDVVGSPGVTTTLGLTNVLLNDGAIPVETTSGSFTVDLVYDIAGTVAFWNGGMISSTLLTLSGDHIYTAESDFGGAYTVTDVPSDDYVLTPSKSDSVSGISAYDASLVLQHDAGLVTLTGYASTAADVNKSGQITSMDAFYILQQTVGLSTLPFPGAGVVWDFTPSSRSYSGLSSDLTGQDFTAILLGDPSGNWSPTGALLGETVFRAETMTATLALPQASVLPGELITVPLALSLPEGTLYSADIVVTYDPAVASAVAVNNGPLSTGWMLFSNLGTPGEIRVAMAGATPIATSGELLLLSFQAIGTSGAQTSLHLTRGDLNEGGIPSHLQDGSLYVARLVAADFAGTPTSGPAPLTVVFTNTTTGDYSTSQWDFGDGNTSTLQNPTHIYNAAGAYTVTLTVSGLGGSDVESKASYIRVWLLQVEGAIRYWNGGLGVPETTLSLAGSHAYSTTSDASGVYLLSGILAGHYDLTPSKSDEPNGISAYDASLALQHAAGLINLTGYQAAAADVNKSGAISSLDASYMLQFAVGLITVPFPGASTVWDFDPATITYADLSSSQINQDFTAILLGDPSGSWPLTPTARIPSGFAGNSAVVYIEAGPPDEHDVVTATIWLDPAFAAVYSLDATLSYDPEQVSPLDIVMNSALGEWSCASNVSVPGRIRLAVAGATPVTEPTALVALRFDLSQATQPSPLDFTQGWLNEGAVPAEWAGTILTNREPYGIYLPIVIK